MTVRNGTAAAAVDGPTEDDVLVLLAIDRAGDENDGPGEDRYEYCGPAGSADCERIARHLGGGYERAGDFMFWKGYEIERARSACKRLMRAGLVSEHRPKHGKIHYSVSPDGDALLAELQADDDCVMPDLPESPRHRTWRERRETALANLPGIRDGLRVACTSATVHIEDETPRAMYLDDEREHSWRNLGSVIESGYEELIKALRDVAAEEPE